MADAVNDAPRGDHSIAELRAMRAGETPAAAAAPGSGTPETPAEETPAAAGESTETAPASGPETTQDGTEGGPERGADGKFTPNVQKRIDKAVKAQRDAERRAEEAERRLAETSQGSRPAGAQQQGTGTNAPKPAEAKKPALENFDSYEAYNEALVQWTVEQRETAREQTARETREREQVEQINSSHKERVEAAREAHADFDEVIQAAKGINISDAAMRALVESGVSGELLYHLCSNVDEAKRIAALSPIRQVAELGKLEARFEAKPAETKTQEKKPLPRPPAHVGGGTGAAKELDLHDSKLPLSDFKRRVAALRTRR